LSVQLDERLRQALIHGRCHGVRVAPAAGWRYRRKMAISWPAGMSRIRSRAGANPRRSSSPSLSPESEREFRLDAGAKRRARQDLSEAPGDGGVYNNPLRGAATAGPAFFLQCAGLTRR
jgi:hypothetical protein